MIDNKLREDLEIQLEYHGVGKYLGYNDSDLSSYLCSILSAAKERDYSGGDIVMLSLPCKRITCG